MDKEILYIYEVLATTKTPLTAADISKEIFIRYDFRLSRKIVRNYLWSYFRANIEYDASNYTFVFSDDQFLISDIDVSTVVNPPRAISAQFEGARIKAMLTSVLVKAIALINYKNKSSTSKIDLIKQINRTIEQMQSDND